MASLIISAVPASDGTVDAHPSPPLFAQGLLQHLLVPDLLGDHDLVGDRPGAVVLEQKRGERLVEGGGKRLFEGPLRDQHTLSEREHHHPEPALFRKDAPDVPVYPHVLVDTLLLDEPLYRVIFLFPGLGLLEIPRAGGLLDLCFEHLQQLFVPSLEKVGNLFHDQPIRLLVYLPHAGGRAHRETREDTRPRPAAKDGVPAPPHGIEGLNDLQEVFCVFRVRMGPEIEGAVVFDRPRDAEGGKFVLHAQSQGDIGLVVLQDHVVLRLVLLDEVILQQERLFFIPGQHDRHILGRASRAARFCRPFSPFRNNS